MVLGGVSGSGVGGQPAIISRKWRNSVKAEGKLKGGGDGSLKIACHENNRMA